MKVLVVDDDRLARLMAREALAAAGYEVIEAEDVASARPLVAAADVVLLDIVMPNQSGLSLLPEALSPTRAVIMVTAQGSATNVEQLKEMRLGDYHVLTHPVTPEDLWP